MVIEKSARPQKSLRHVLARLTAGNVAYLGAQFVSFIALAHWASVTEVGRFSWALALTSPIFLLADMRTRQIQLSTTAAQIHYRSFLVQRIAIQAVALPLVALLALWFSPDEDTVEIVLGLAILKTLEGVMNVSIGEHLRREHTGKVALIQTTRGIIYGFSFSITILVTSQASMAVFVTSATLLVPLFLGHFMLDLKDRRRPPSKEQILDLTKQSWPLGLGFFIGSVTINGPRFLIEAFHGVESLAIFTAVSYVIVLANTIVDSVTQGIMPRFAGYWRTGRGEQALAVTKRISLIVACLGIIGVVLAFFMGEKILVLIFGGAYGTGQLALVALFCAATLQYVASTLRSTLIAGGMRIGVLWSSVLTLITTMGIASIWVPVSGPVSAGWSLAIGQAVQLLIYLSLASRYLRNESRTS